ncbi:DIP1984 family protein [Prauserella sp. ASG 168]|uniref:DIP1984 family protein n=2 Tax=Prauserella cavernicola TaxID=2800127 RepID=A0A934V300_9PSEU|nr:DIP1984 family protein [Prauserella cavernicola]
MTVAEALAIRSATAKRIDQLRARIVGNARYQEGDSPVEDPVALLAEAEQALGELEALIRRINRTNAATSLGEGTITDALARRDVLRQRHSVLTAAADAGAARNEFRHLRSELRTLTALPVSELRVRADQTAAQLRQIDADIQRANWTVTLLP